MNAGRLLNLYDHVVHDDVPHVRCTIAAGALTLCFELHPVHVSNTVRAPISIGARHPSSVHTFTAIE